MNEIPLELVVIVIFACFLLHLLFVAALRSRLKNDQRTFDAYFTKTSFVAIGSPRIDKPFSMRAKYFVPFSGWSNGLNGIERMLLLGAQVSVCAGVLALFSFGLFVL